MHFKRKDVLYFVSLSFLLVLFVKLSTKVAFHDVPEYLNLIKGFAGYEVGKMFSTHSFLYTYFVSWFVKVFPSMLTIKLLNMIWIILIALVLWIFTKDRKSFLLALTSPIGWLVSIQISPILPASFFLLLMYLLFKKWEITQKKVYLISSALSGGLSFALYAPSSIILSFFMLVFFFNRNFKDFLLFFVFLLPTFFLRLILDWYVTGFFLYSLVRYFGANLVVLLGGNPNTPFLQGLFNIHEYFFLIFLISPLLFYIYKLNFKKYKNEVIFLSLCFLFLIIRGGSMKYFFIFIPIFYVLLISFLNKKQILFHILLSFILIGCFSHFYLDAFSLEYTEHEINEDMGQIINDFNPRQVSFFEIDQDFFLYLFYKESPEMVKMEEYQMSLNNETYFVEYKIIPDYKVNLYKQLELKASLKRDLDHQFGDILYVSGNDGRTKEGYFLLKCYDVFCVYDKEQDKIP